MRSMGSLSIVPSIFKYPSTRLDRSSQTDRSSKSLDIQSMDVEAVAVKAKGWCRLVSEVSSFIYSLISRLHNHYT